MVVLIFLVILGLTFENLTRVTEDPLPLGNSTIQILIFRPVCIGSVDLGDFGGGR